MRARAAHGLAAALAVAGLVLAPGCGGGPGAKEEPRSTGPVTSPGAGGGDGAPEREPSARPPRAVDPGELVAACAEHLTLLHRRRLARELGPDLAKLAGPVPTIVDLDQSLARLHSDGIDASDRELVSAGTFATHAASFVERGGHAFIAWTPNVDDVGLAKIGERRKGSFGNLWGKARAYDVLVLDGFRVADYPRFREEALEHAQGASDLPRRRGSLIVIDRVALQADEKRLAADARPDRAELKALAQSLGTEGLLKEVELREAAYLRFQDDAKGGAALDRLATWAEALQGEPDLAFAGGAIGAGDRPEEARRASALTSLFLELGRRGEARSDVASLLKLPKEERTKKLKELAPQMIKAELPH